MGALFCAILYKGLEYFGICGGPGIIKFFKKRVKSYIQISSVGVGGVGTLNPHVDQGSTIRIGFGIIRNFRHPLGVLESIPCG